MSPSFEVMITIESPRPGIDPGTSSSQDKYANHYTNGESYDIPGKIPQGLL